MRNLNCEKLVNQRKTFLSIIFLFILGIYFLNFSNFNNVYADEIPDKATSSEETFYGMTDDYIKNILAIAHSNGMNEQCGFVLPEDITDKDIQEFKDYYRALRMDRLNSYSYYFESKTGWVKRPDGITLSCYYKDTLVKNTGSLNANTALAVDAFRALKAKHSSSPNWKNTASMEQQFLCHALTIGKWKRPWNIEPWRTETNFDKVVKGWCNP